MAVEMRWSVYAAVVLFSVQAAHSHRSLQGLSCINDFVRNLSCTWNGSPFDPGVDCWISGVRRTLTDLVMYDSIFSEDSRSCKVKQQGTSPPGCSIFFEMKTFTYYEYMPNISMTCNGTLVANITKYYPRDHVKMHPPGVPNVTCSTNETWISWNPGSPRSNFCKNFEFQIQTKRDHQTWKEAHVSFTEHQELRVYTRQLQGPHQVRVRVRVNPKKYHNPHWSDWSQTTSWVGIDTTAASQHPGWIQDQASLVTLLVVVISGFIVVPLVVYRCCIRRILLKRKEVPNPSKYFGTLHSVHEGNLKEWLNPLAAPESFFRAAPCDHISAVEICEPWDVDPSTFPSSSSTTALLHFRGYPGSDTSGVVDNSSSSSSSCFSNMGYFMSSSTGSSAQTNPTPAYFTYSDDFPSPHNSHSLRLSLCPSISTSSKYESLKMEPQSPDSGFGIDQEDNNMDMDVENEDQEDHRSPLFILPLVSHSPPPPPPQPASPTQVSSVTHQVEAPVGAAADVGNYAAWPVTMCRSSSMPVEPCKTGYLTLKELQTTFSNKSI